MKFTQFLPIVLTIIKWLDRITMAQWKIATWNVNSLRVRLPQVLDWLSVQKPDVLALQEIKTLEIAAFLEVFQAMGYQSLFNVQKTYNGVALLSKEPMNAIEIEIPDFEDPQRRVLAVTVGDIRILNLYVPNGESVDSQKFDYKLAWLKALTVWIEKVLRESPKTILLGDFNIAPSPEDVYDPEVLSGHVLYTDAERNAFQLLLSLGLVDCFRLFSQPPHSYSWWDYRLNAFKRKMGLRIDHILASQSLAPTCLSANIDREMRGLERPSDHAPVMAVFEIE